MKLKPILNDELIEHKFTGISTHTGGEITRIIISGFPKLKGKTMLDRKN